MLSASCTAPHVRTRSRGRYATYCNIIVFLSPTAGALIHDALSKLYCATRKNEIAGQIRDLLEAENAPEKIHIISQYLEMMETNSSSEARHDHEDWFEGLYDSLYHNFIAFPFPYSCMNQMEKIHIISQYLEMMETNSSSEARHNHKDWFEGLYDSEKIHIISQYLEMMETNSSSEAWHDHEDWFEGLYDSEKIHIISQYLEMMETNSSSEAWHDHEDWFEGLYDSEKINIISQYLEMMETNSSSEAWHDHEDWFEGLYDSEKIHIISQYLEMMETNSSSEARHDHQDWFEGLYDSEKIHIISQSLEMMETNSSSEVRHKDWFEGLCDSDGENPHYIAISGDVGDQFIVRGAARSPGLVRMFV